MSERRWKPSPELAREIRQSIRAARNSARRVGKSIRSTRKAARVSAELDERADPRELRGEASLVLRCDDCAGRVIAYVIYVRGKPMLWARQRDGSGSRHWLGTWWGDSAWCTGREYALHARVLLAELPPPKSRRAVIRLGHDGRVGPLA